MNRLIFFTCPIIFSGVAFFNLLLQPVKAQSNTDSVNATIKMSVCGNGIVEGGEDCDGVVTEKSCFDLGYAGGSLSCDSSCSYKTTECVLSPPTPVPTGGTVTNAPVTETWLTTSPNQTTIPPASRLTQASRPTWLANYDFNQDGQLGAGEVFNAVRLWLDEWRQLIGRGGAGSAPLNPQRCDTNNDNLCDLKDLSILLYYVGR